MNERIKELGRQAMSDVMNGHDPYCDADKMYIPEEFMEKFAELIIKECIGIMVVGVGNNKTLNAIWDVQRRGRDVNEALDSIGGY